MIIFNRFALDVVVLLHCTKSQSLTKFYLFFHFHLSNILCNRYASVLANGSFLVGGERGNDDHFIEQHERKNTTTGSYQKRVNFFTKMHIVFHLNIESSYV